MYIDLDSISFMCEIRNNLKNESVPLFLVCVCLLHLGAVTKASIANVTP